MLVLPDFFPPDGSDVTSQLLEDEELQVRLRLLFLSDAVGLMGNLQREAPFVCKHV